MAEAFKAPKIAEQSPATDEQRKLADNLRLISQSRQLSTGAKAQQTHDAVRDFIVKNPAQVTPESVKTFLSQLSAMRTNLQTAVREFDRELERNYNHYWGAERTTEAFAARTELRNRTETMLHSLDQMAYSLQQFVNTKEGRTGNVEVEAGIEKLFGGRAKSPGAEDSLMRGLSQLGEYMRASRSVTLQINHIGSMGKIIGEEVETGKRDTEAIGAVIAATEIAVASMFIASALAVGIAGAAVIGGVGNLAGTAIVTGVTEKRWITPAEAVKSAAIGAALGALGHLGHARHLTRLEKGMDTIDLSLNASENIDALAAAGRIAAPVARVEAAMAKAVPFARATARTTELTEHTYHEVVGQRHEADKRVAAGE